MYATVRQYRVSKSIKDENTRLVRSELLPELRVIPGFIDYYFIDTGNDAAISITIFADKRSADHSNDVAAAFVKKLSPDVELTAMHGGRITVRQREALPL